MKNTVEKVIKRSIKICKNWKILTRNKNFTAGQKMGANALLFFRENIRQYNSALSFAPMGEVNAKSKNVNGKGLTLKVAFTQFLPSLPSIPTQISLPINKL